MEDTVVEDSERAAASGASSQTQLAPFVWWRLAKWLLRLFLLLLAGYVAYYWVALSLRALVRFDGQGLSPHTVALGRPIDYTPTMLACLGPLGWMAGLGVLGLALIMALTVYRWPWPLRVMVVSAPMALFLCRFCAGNPLPWVRASVLSIAVVGLLTAASVAVLCRPIARRLLPWVPPK
jgi:hypothetical protein